VPQLILSFRNPEYTILWVRKEQRRKVRSEGGGLKYDKKAEDKKRRKKKKERLRNISTRRMR
jgi:hypothetical protein